MTTVQVNYWKAMNDKFANYETQRHNKALEAQNQYALEETKRHNLEMELVNALQAKASLASAAAAQTSAAANYKNALTREKELVEQQYVNERTLSRQDYLAQAEHEQIQSVVGLNQAKTSREYVEAERVAATTGLITVQTALEQERISYTQQQTRTEKSKMYLNYANTADVVWDDIVGLVKGAQGLESTIYGLNGIQ